MPIPDANTPVVGCIGKHASQVASMILGNVLYPIIPKEAIICKIKIARKATIF